MVVVQQSPLVACLFESKLLDAVVTCETFLDLRSGQTVMTTLTTNAVLFLTITTSTTTTTTTATTRDCVWYSVQAVLLNVVCECDCVWHSVQAVLLNVV